MGLRNQINNQSLSLSPNALGRREKREIIKNRGKILDMREVRERVAEKPSQSPS